MNDLFLEADGVGSDDDAFLVLDSGKEGGDEIGIAFANAGTGFDGEMLA